MGAIELKAKDFERIVLGSNEAAWEIYFILHELLQKKGLFDVLNGASGPLTAAQITERLGLSPKVTHRVQVALDGLTRIGCLRSEGALFASQEPRRPEHAVDHAVIDFTYSPAFRRHYLEIYRSGVLFDPAFSLTFGQGEADLWEGLLNSPANAIWRDLGRDWVAYEGGRVIDLGFGTPKTLVELSTRVGPAGKVYGLESSAHFVERARQETASLANMGGIFERDINEALGTLSDAVAEPMDGVTFVGALHFVQNLELLVREIAKMSSGAARVALPMFFVRRRCFSAPAFDMHRNLFSPVPTAKDPDEVERLMEDAGFECRMKTNFGSYCSLYFERYPASFSAQ